jgi:hypothetical protein
MFTSTADVFRTRQALRDLLEVVHQNREVIFRPGLTGAERDAIEKILNRNCRIVATDDARAYSEIRLAAAMPDEDFAGFIAATALLLADRLQQGCGADNLFWNWDAFRDHYMLADPPVRAALMNGFRLGDILGRVSVGDPPSEQACLTLTRGDVVASLRLDGAIELARAIEAGVPAREAGEIWARSAKGTLDWHELAAFRLLYERPESMSPPRPDETPLIPWC